MVREQGARATGSVWPVGRAAACAPARGGPEQFPGALDP
jgi:hypothetical protein